jgi:hypothetical protein
MKSIFLLIVLIVTSRLFAETPEAWLNDYYSICTQYAAKCDSVFLKKHPEWAEKLRLLQDIKSADNALYRYLFIYHLMHDPQILLWQDGDWWLSIAVCNCGREGSVPTDIFHKLFLARAEAENRFHAHFGELGDGDILKELQADTYRERKNLEKALAPLKARFDEIVNKPNQALQHNDHSWHELCLRTPRASCGRG